MGKSSFLLSNDHKEIFDALPPEKAGALIQAVFAYEAGNDPNLSDDLKIAFIPIRQWLDKNRESYETVCKERSEAGKKGGRPKKQKDNEESKKSNCFLEKAKKAEYELELELELDPELDNNGAKAPLSAQARKRFAKPTVDEVRAYCVERNNGIDAQAFVDHYESKGWLIGKTPMKDWKAAVRTWEQKRKQDGRASPSGRASYERPIENCDHLAEDLFANEYTGGVNRQKI